jgi:hypothetical protein
MNKYGARRTEGVHGILFRSKLEANFAQQLELRRHAENPAERVDWWVYEVAFWLPVLKGRRAVRHILDFVYSQGGCLKLLEVKGKETPAGRTKRLWLETHLGRPIEVWKG